MLQSRRAWVFLCTLFLGLGPGAGPLSHHTGPIFLDILRVINVPEALGPVAPIRRRIVGNRVQSFATTRDIYDRSGAELSLGFY
jgi:hypothetical protein